MAFSCIQRLSCFSLLAATLTVLLTVIPGWTEQPVNLEQTKKGLSNSQQKTQKSIHQQTSLLKTIATLSLEPPEGVTQTSISLFPLLKQAYQQSPSRELAKSLLKEAELKQKQVKGKRLLFFFKYLNAHFLEGAAASDVSASQAEAEQAVSDLIVRTSKAYYQVLQAYLGRQIAYQTVQQSLAQLEAVQAGYEIGDKTSFDVLAIQTELLTRYQTFLSRQNDYQLACQLVQNVMENSFTSDQENATEKTLWYTPSETPNSENLHQLFRDTVNTHSTQEYLYQVALANRADAKELNARTDQLDNMVNASAYNFDRYQTELLKTTYTQLQLKQAVLKQQIYADVLTAWAQYQKSRHQVALGTEQQSLALTSLKQTIIGEQAGFSSSQAVAKAQITEANSRLAYSQAVIQQQVAQVNVLAQLGKLTPEALGLIVENDVAESSN